MAEGTKGNVWERTNVTNLLRNGVSGTYYARVKVGNKQKWRSLETDAFSVAKLLLGDAEKEMRAHASATSTDSTKAGGGELMVSRFIAAQRADRCRRRAFGVDQGQAGGRHQEPREELARATRPRHPARHRLGLPRLGRGAQAHGYGK